MKTIKGKVISTKTKNMVIVSVDTFIAHPKYPKRIHKESKYHAHNTTNVKVGDMVTLIETKPISKTKRWYVAN